MEKSIELFEGARATNYDNFVRTWIPHYAEMMSLVPSVLSQFISKSDTVKGQHILVAGCGSGNEIIEIMKCLPTVNFTGVDPSPDMIAQAATKLEQYNNIKFITSTVDMLDANLKYDAATLLLVMHFFPEQEKLKLLSSISERLKPNAPLIIADIFGSGEAFLCNLSLLRSVLLTSIPEKEVEERIIRIENGIHYMDEEKLNELLSATGFKKSTLFFQSTVYGAWVCTRK